MIYEINVESLNEIKSRGALAYGYRNKGDGHYQQW